MNLAEKGATAPVKPFRTLQATMTWLAGVDLDIAAVAIPKGGGAPKIIYFGNDPGKADDGQGITQSLDKFPYILRSGDAGVGDTKGAGGKNEEWIKIGSLTPWDEVHIVAWDYGAVKKGEGARFRQSNVALNVADENGNAHDVKLSLAEAVGLASKENVCVIATVDNRDPSGARLVNSSATAFFGGTKDMTTENFIRLVRPAA
ncbi:MAG: hypothetical protein HY457_03125 [Parcubacteria group bacterium]|nr:hypothetical protein [Parcubacteria group bacterium]